MASKRIEQISNKLNEYYKSQRVDYNEKFSDYCIDNEIEDDTLDDDFAGDPTDATILNYFIDLNDNDNKNKNYNFPFEINHKLSKQQQAKFIIDLLKQFDQKKEDIFTPFTVNKRPKDAVSDDEKGINIDGEEKFDPDTCENIPSLPFTNNQTYQEDLAEGDKFGDRRHVIKPYEDGRAIIKCIGRLSVWYGEYKNGKQQARTGTATVYAAQDRVAYAITCAHNVNHADKEKKTIKQAKTVIFLREIPENKTEKYEADIINVTEYYEIVKKKNKKKIISYDEDDLALLKFQDHDGFYTSIFEEQQDIVHLGCSDNIKSHEIYSLFGYPGKCSIYSQVEEGKFELRGMCAPSVGSEKGQDGVEYDMFVKIVGEDEALFKYNAIDTESGQSGAAIWTESVDGKYQIVGIHTQGGSENWGVALNDDKMKWILESIHALKPPPSVIIKQNIKMHANEERGFDINDIKNNQDSKDNQDDDGASSDAKEDEEFVFEKELVYPDKRHKIDEPYLHQKHIIQCIGQIAAWYGGDVRGAKKVLCTGTVFFAKEGKAYIITAANGVVTSDNGMITTAISIIFKRQAPNGSHKKYKAQILKVYADFSLEGNRSNDIALLVCNDDDSFYSKIFQENKDIVGLGCSDDINEKDAIEYGIYGYPMSRLNDKMKPGEMWGMTSFSRHKGGAMEVFVRRNKKKDLFIYNAFTTQPGMGGSAIFMSLMDDTYVIIGVHIGSRKHYKWGVALNRDKIKWIQQIMLQYK